MRPFIRAAIMVVGAVAGVGPSPVAAQAPAIDLRPFVAHAVHPKVHLLSTPDDFYGPAIGNIVLVEQSDGFVVVDSGTTAAHGRVAVRYAGSLAAKPIKAVLITHWHNDHPQGVSAIRDAFPRVRIIATPRTEAGMLGPEAFDVGYAPGAKWDQGFAGLIAKAKVDLQALLDDPATAPDRKERLKKALVQYDQMAGDFTGTYIVPPTETFERRLSIPDPDVPVEFLHLGRANTDGDAVAWLPRQKIVATGDIVVSPIPFGFGSYSGDWIETIGKIKALGFSTLIPGHGLPQSDGAYLDKLVAALGDVRAQVIPLAKAGLPLEQVRKTVDFTKSIESFGSTPRIRLNLPPLFFDPMVGSVFKEALGQPIVQGEGGGEPSLPRDTPPPSRAKRHTN